MVRSGPFGVPNLQRAMVGETFRRQLHKEVVAKKKKILRCNRGYVQFSKQQGVEEKGAGLVQPGEKKIEEVPSCCHPLPYRVTEERERQSLLAGPQGKDKRQWAQAATRKILVEHTEKIPSTRVVQVWDRHQRGDEISVLGDSPD